MKHGIFRLGFTLALLCAAAVPAACTPVVTPLPSVTTATATSTITSTSIVTLPYTVTMQQPPVTMLPSAVTLQASTVTQTVTIIATRTVTVTGTTIATGATFSYEATLAPTSPISVGDNVTVSGSGFPPGTPVSIIVDDTVLNIQPVPTVNTGGSFNVNFPAPALAKGLHAVRVRAGDTSPVIGNINIKEKLLSLAPISGPPGTVVKVSGAGFAPGNAPVTMDGISIATITVEPNGSFTDAPFTIPAAASAGQHPIAIQGLSGPMFTVIPSPRLAVSPASGQYGDTITLTGTGFGILKPITMVIDDIYNLGTSTTNAVGAFTATFTVPNLPAGAHTIKASDGSALVPSAQLIINPKLSQGAITGKAGDRISLLGTGFAASRQVVVCIGDVSLGTDPAVIRTSQYGTFSAYITIPTGSGTVTITATDGTNSAVATFTYLP